MTSRQITRALLTALAGLLTLAGHAADATLFSHPLAADNTTFASVRARLEAAPVVRAEFTQEKHIQALARPLVATGRLLFSRADGVCWETLTPFPSAIVMTPKGLRQRGPDGVFQPLPNTDQPIVKNLTAMLTAIFGADIAALRRHFDLYFSGTDAQWQLGLKPRDQESARLMDWLVLTGSQGVDAVDLHETNGDTTHIVLRPITPSPDKLTEQERHAFALP